MEEKNVIFPSPSPTSEGDCACVVRSTRDEKPVHYILQIQSFSLLKGTIPQSQRGRYESHNFNVGGYQWKLALYPNGDEKRNGSDHISLYLVTAEDAILSTNSEVNVMFTFLVYDNLKDKYLTVQDGKVRRFHALKTEWGFPKLLPLHTFNDASNGFLVDDCCVFGVDIFVMKGDGKREALSFVKEPKNNKFTWKINKFSQLHKTYYESDPFTVENYRWKILLYPRGYSQATTGFLSLYVILFDGAKQLPQGSQVYMDYEIAILNQLGVGQRKGTCKGWFELSCGKGHSHFMALSDLKEPTKGFIRDDTLIIEMKTNVISNLKKFV